MIINISSFYSGLCCRFRTHNGQSSRRAIAIFFDYHFFNSVRMLMLRRYKVVIRKAKSREQTRKAYNISYEFVLFYSISTPQELEFV